MVMTFYVIVDSDLPPAYSTKEAALDAAKDLAAQDPYLTDRRKVHVAKLVCTVRATAPTIEVIKLEDEMRAKTETKVSSTTETTTTHKVTVSREDVLRALRKIDVVISDEAQVGIRDDGGLVVELDGDHPLEATWVTRERSSE